MGLRGRVVRVVPVMISIWLSACAASAAAATATVTVIAGPPRWTAETTASFRFGTSEPTELECRLDAHRNARARWEPCVDGHTIEGPLEEGRHVLDVRAVVERDDDPAHGEWVWRVDVTPPSVPTFFEPETLWQRDRNVTLSWSASDGYSGVGDYTVRYDEWAASGAVYAGIPWVTQSKITGATFIARGGRTYCFEATARDRAGNSASGWSARRCFALPLDDRALERKGRWVRGRDVPRYFLDTYIESKQRGAWARREVVGRRIALLATKCPTCGSIAVRWRGRVVKKIRLTARRARPSRLVPILTFPEAQRGTVRIDVLSSGRLVRIDALGVSAA